MGYVYFEYHFVSQCFRGSAVFSLSSAYNCDIGLGFEFLRVTVVIFWHNCHKA